MKIFMKIGYLKSWIVKNWKKFPPLLWKSHFKKSMLQVDCKNHEYWLQFINEKNSQNNKHDFYISIKKGLTKRAKKKLIDLYYLLNHNMRNKICEYDMIKKVFHLLKRYHKNTLFMFQRA